ncbi:MAG: sigma-70 family RNA polymerase sigma factor [Siphonobacter aquaeclarae]|nr:sigma-70 family RNA polymerase sigma factor [Siphonobacter aquaeclarae]
MCEQEQQELWLKFRAGDADALGALARSHFRLLFNYACQFTKDREQIKDCIQDLFLELWTRRDTLRESPFVTVYLLKALRNNLLRKLRREKWITEAEPVDAHDLADGLTPEALAIQFELSAENQHRLRAAIASLSPRQQEIIFLRFYEGLSAEEITEVMKINPQSVYNLLHTALKQLKTTWIPESNFFLLALYHVLETN